MALVPHLESEKIHLDLQTMKISSKGNICSKALYFTANTATKWGFDTMDFKSNNQYLLKVQTFSFNPISFINCLP